MAAPPRDTPQQIDLLHAAGGHREIEFDGVGLWTRADLNGRAFTGASNALAYHRGETLPYDDTYATGRTA